MSEYRVCPHCRKPITDGLIEAVEYVVDVRVVRCRDCKWCMAYASATYCIRMSTHTVEPDGFCAWGERRES